MSNPNSVPASSNTKEMKSEWDNMAEGFEQTPATKDIPPILDLHTDYNSQKPESIPETNEFSTYVENLLETLVTDGATVAVTDEIINNAGSAVTMTDRLADKWEDLVTAANAEIERSKMPGLEGTDFEIESDPNKLIVNEITRLYKPTNIQIIGDFIFSNSEAAAFVTSQAENHNNIDKPIPEQEFENLKPFIADDEAADLSNIKPKPDFLEHYKRNNIAFQAARNMIKQNPDLTPEEALRAVANKYLLSEHAEDNAIGADVANFLDNHYQAAVAASSRNIGYETAAHALKIYRQRQEPQRQPIGIPALDPHAIS